MEEINSLHNSFVMQLVEQATKSYNQFSRGFEIIKTNVEEAENLFQNVLKNNDYYLSSMEFYNDQFYGLDRSDELLYLGQLLSLQVKACRNLVVINRNKSIEGQALYYESRMNQYKEDLYFYNLLAKDLVKAGPILMMFTKDAHIEDSIIEKATLRYNEYIKKHQ